MYSFFSLFPFTVQRGYASTLINKIDFSLFLSRDGKYFYCTNEFPLILIMIVSFFVQMNELFKFVCYLIARTKLPLWLVNYMELHVVPMS